MSGPKVVRVVTRAEMLEMCRIELARTDVALAEWNRVSERNAVGDDALRAEARVRRERLNALLQQDRFGDVQRGSNELCIWLDQKLAECLEAKWSAEEQARRAGANLGATATSLIEVLRNVHSERAAELRAALEAGIRSSANSKPEGTGSLNKLVAQAFSMVADMRKSGTPTANQIELAAQLGAGEDRVDLQEWVERHGIGGHSEDPRVAMVNRQVAELGALSEQPVSADICSRSEQASSEGDVVRRGMLLDALAVELAAAIQTAKRQVAARRELAALHVEYAASENTGVAPTVFDTVADWIVQGDLAKAESVLQDLRDRQRKWINKRAAELRREAVLSGLKRLGYEVRDGMGTIWNQNGRVVIRNPTLPGYGVEIGGNAGDAFQVRAVGIQGVHDSMDGRDVELNWCAAVSALHELLANEGVELVIERSTPAGAQPLRTVPNEWREDDQAEPERTGRLRS